jgi:hypothetical protein
MKSAFSISLIMVLLAVAFSCKDDDPEPSVQVGKISLNFMHLVDGLPLQKDTLKYVNSAGNPYEVDQVMYFISDVKLFNSDGSIEIINEWKDIHYVDVDIPSTLIWDVYDDIPAGTYDSITFIFGITGEKNNSFMFVNPPEVNMVWPDVLGGGYHYMMINGKWRNTENFIQNYAFHLGIGQLYKGDVIEVDSIYAFVQNYFTVKLGDAAFTIEKDRRTELEIVMNIDSWFDSPHIYDHDYWGGAIMQNQSAMQMVKENGYDVFSIGDIKQVQ